MQQQRRRALQDAETIARVRDANRLRMAEVRLRKRQGEEARRASLPEDETILMALMHLHDVSASSIIADAMRFKAGQVDARQDVEAVVTM